MANITLKHAATMVGNNTQDPYTIRTIHVGQYQYVFGPNFSIAFADEGIAQAADAFLGSNEIVRRIDSRDKDGAHTAW